MTAPPILIPQTYDYVTLHDKRDFEDVIMLRILTWEDYPELLEYAQCHHKGPYKREAGISVKEDVTEGQKARSEWCGHELRNVGDF